MKRVEHLLSEASGEEPAASAVPPLWRDAAAELPRKSTGQRPVRRRSKSMPVNRRTSLADKKRFRVLFEDAPVGMLMITRNGRFKYINSKFRQLFGYNLRDIPNGRTWFRKAYPDAAYREQVISAWIKDLENSAPGERRPRAFTARCKDGSEKIVNFESVLLQTGENLVTCEDITQRRHAEESLRKSEEEAKSLAKENAIMAEIGRIVSSTLNIEEIYDRFSQEVKKIIPVDGIGINTINMKDQTTSILYATGAKIEGRGTGATIPLSGTLAEEVFRTRSPVLFQTEDKEEILRRFPALLPSVEVNILSMISVPLFSKDQLFGVLHFQSRTPYAYGEKDLGLAERVGHQIAGAIAIAQLFSERRQAEEALRESEEKYRTILENIEDGYYEVDLAGNLVFFNDPVCRLFGYTKDELKGRNGRHLTDPDHAERLFQTFNQVYRTGKSAKVFDWEVIRKDGTKRFIEASVSLIRDRGGRPAGFRGIARDITDRKHMENELQAEKRRFQALSEHAPFGMVMVGRDGTFTYVNPKFEELFGYRLEEVPDGRTWFRKTFPDPRYRHNVISTWMKDLEIFGVGQKRPRIFTATCKDGTEKVTHFIPILLETGENLMTCDDITERIRTEEQILLANEKLQYLLSSTSAVIYAAKMSGNYDRSFISQNITPMAGYQPPEFLEASNSWIDRIHPEDRQGMLTELSRLLDRDHVSCEYRFRRKDGTYLWLRDEMKLARDEGNRPLEIIGCLFDITERKKAEEALRESEEKYRTLFEGSKDAVYITSREGRFIDFNQALMDLFGYSKEELVNMQVQETYARLEDRYAFQKEIEEKGFVSDYEVRLRRKDGSDILCLFSSTVRRCADGSVLGYHGIIRDITERKLIEEALRDSEARYRAIFESTGTAMLIIEEDTKVSLSNAETEKITGYSADELEAKKGWADLVVLEDLEKLMEYHHLRRVDPGTAPKNYEFRIKHKDGSLRDMFMTVSLIPKTKKSIASLLDVTELKQAEGERKALEEQLRQSQKMEAIGRLAGGIAHDFNNLLTIIKGFSQLSLSELPEGHSSRENIEGIKKATDRASTLIRKILAFSRRQLMEMQVLDLNALLKDLDKMLRRIIGEEIQLMTSLAADLGSIKADPGQIEQVILNLAVNAKDAMPKGGILSIETSNVELDEAYARSHISVTPGHYVLFSVSDTGIGMTPEVRDRVFEPFYTTKSADKGTGLGLSTVYGIVKQSGGHIWVYSEPGQGTIFRIYLPRIDEPLEAEENKWAEEADPLGTETIMLVEDDDDVRRLAAQILQGQGYTVLEAPSGNLALEQYKRYAGRVHLLVTDVVMPGMSGPELVEQLRSFCPEMKILYMSGYTDTTITRNGVLRSDIAYLQKPFSPSVLTRKIREVLDR